MALNPEDLQKFEGLKVDTNTLSLVLENSYPERLEIKVPESATQWLKQLNSPVYIDIEGHDKSRTRVVSTLLHANEPSGFIAVHRWLRFYFESLADSDKYVPAVNIRIILSSVEAAKQLPLFHQRYVDGDADINRLFSTTEPSTPAEIRAAQIKRLIRDVHPEAVVDLHNTSGIGHPFSVCICADDAHRQLASYFCKTMIHTGLSLGSLMEQDFDCPVVTIECGGVSDEMSHEVAFQGLNSFFNAATLGQGHHLSLAKIYTKPLRVELEENASLSYADSLNESTDITLVEHIERYNLGVTGENTLIGWSKRQDLPLQIKTESGTHSDISLLKCINNEIRTSRPLRIFMATPSAVIAKKDCLFYAVLDQ